MSNATRAGLISPGTWVSEEFLVKRLIKAGGFGAVYETTQRSTGQPRALKILHGWMIANNPKSVSRFQLEATAASRVDSEHVVQVVSAGVDAMAGPWIAMEYLV